MFNIDSYNRLPPIQDASSAFHKQLKFSGLTIETLLRELLPLFSEGGNAGRYGVWLLHHHYNLVNGERMVSNGDIMLPSTETSPLIVPERWSATGEEMEYRVVNNVGDVPPPPSAEFMKKFKSILDAKGIDCLGVCYTPSSQEIEKIRKGFVCLETTYDESRKHAYKFVHGDDPSLSGQTTFRTSWTMSDGCFFACVHVCPPGCLSKVR